MSDLWIASYLLLWIVVAGQTVLLLGVLRQLGLLQMRFGSDPGILITHEGLDRGSLAPDFAAADVQGRGVVKRSDFLGRRLLLILVSPTCMSCKQLIPHLNAIADEYGEDVAMLTVCAGSSGDCAAFARLYRARTRVVADPSNSIAGSLGVSATPFAFLLDETGRVLIRGIANDWTQLERMLHEEGTFQTRPWADAPGTRAPLSEVPEA